MNTSLEHLPDSKRQALKWALDIIQEMVAPDMLILFGSYARGDWVEELADDGVHYQYQSDFDLLAVVKNEHTATKIERKKSLRDRLNRELKTPVSLIAEDIQFVNRGISKGQYFYTDILREGILLHNTGKLQLASPKALHPNERKQLAEEDFEYWITNANKYKEYSDIAYGKNDYNESAFFLHQATERLYGTILLVFTRYKPSTRDLEKLSHRVASVEPRFLPIFPQGTQQERNRFELLRKAYVDARYKPSYTISAEELQWLAARVQQLQQLTEKLCNEKIQSYAAQANSSE